MSEHPNFLIFITDQFNPNCLGYAGHPLVQTPHIDQLAAEGVTFTRMYTPQSLCMPARASLFTGRNPRGHAVRMNGIPLDLSIPTSPAALQNAGYHTRCCGKIHLHTSTPPNGVPLDEVNPIDFPECRPLWLKDTITDLPLPFYGLAGVDYANGHGHNTYGHYVHWLKDNHPVEASLFFEQTPLEMPSPAYDLFNRSSYKWALPVELHPTTWIADRTIDFLNTAKTDEHPYMLMCSIQEPRPPFTPPTPYCYHYDPTDVPPPLKREGEYETFPPHFRQMYETNIQTSGNHSQPMNATTPYYAECAAHYFGLIEMLDDQVGRVMAALRANNLDENTVVIFLSDHGEALGDHGLWGKGPYHYDSVIRVPFIVRWPSKLTLGEHDGVVSLLDFAPTILDLAGVSIVTPDRPETVIAPPALPGNSLLPILMKEDTNEDSCTLVEMDEDYQGFKLRTLVTQRYRLTVYSGQAYGELFDLQKDPQEYHNRWDDPAYRQLRDELHVQLLHQIIQTDSPLPRQLARA